jgi:leader peptidase (prepilin peptidase)/N-methyltransferase
MAFSQVRLRTWVLTATLVTIATVVAVVVRFGLSPQTPAFCALAAAGVPLAFIDAREFRLPNTVTLPAYPACLALLGVAAPYVAGGAGRFTHALIGMAAAVAFFGVLALLSPSGIGLAT